MSSSWPTVKLPVRGTTRRSTASGPRVRTSPGARSAMRRPVWRHPGIRSSTTDSHPSRASALRGKNHSFRLVIGSVVLGKAEVDAAVARIEPPRGDRLLLGEEPHALGAVGFGVPEQRVLPAAEREGGDRDRYRHVDADHADLDLVLEAAGRAAIVGEDGGSVSEGARVDQVHP